MVQTSGTSWHDTNRGMSMFVATYIALYLLVVCLSKILHDRPAIAKYLPEAGMVIIVGFIVGALIHIAIGDDQGAADGLAESILSFDSSIFFIVLLPPIVFNSGYHLHRPLFLRYFTPICLLAFAGTMISVMVVATVLHWVGPFINFEPSFQELLTFGALISATDPVSTLAVFSAKKVDPQLFYLLSGESLLNDAVGLVLFEAFAHLMEVEDDGKMNLSDEVVQVLFDVALNFFGSLLLGSLLGLGVALCLKKFDLRSHPMLELSGYVMVMYAPFVLAEISRLSGIVTVLFTAMAARRYATPNLSKDTAENSDTIFRLVAHLTETLIFLDLGLSVVTILRHGLNVGVFVTTFAACLIGRALNIYPLTMLYNVSQMALTRARGPSTTLVDPSDKNDSFVEELANPDSPEPQMVENDGTIPLKTRHFLCLSGLRGAVSYGLAKMFPDVSEHKATFEVATMLTVLTTTFLFGGMTDWALDKLDLPVGVDEVNYMRSLSRQEPKSNSNCVSCWRRFESTKLRPFVLRDYTPPKKTDAAIVEGSSDEFHYQEQTEGTQQAEDDGVNENQEITAASIYDFGQ